jgi:hypothetical protein
LTSQLESGRLLPPFTESIFATLTQMLAIKRQRAAEVGSETVHHAEPQPRALADPLVEKKGSMARARVASSMPTPVSATESRTYFITATQFPAWRTNSPDPDHRRATLIVDPIRLMVDDARLRARGGRARAPPSPQCLVEHPCVLRPARFADISRRRLPSPTARAYQSAIEACLYGATRHEPEFRLR